MEVSLIKQKALNKSTMIACGFIVLAILLLTTLIYDRTVTINPQTMPINSGPGVKYSPVNTSQKKRVLIIGEQRNWYKVRLNDHQDAWVPSWLIHSHHHLHHDNHIAGAVIAIDPGHGGSDSGAEYQNNSSKSKYMEKTYTLAVAKQLAQQLKASGAQVLMTRTTDKDVGLKERVRMAENDHVDCFISLHLNSSPDNNEGSGVTTYYYHRHQSKPLAQQVSHQFHNLPLDNRGVEFGDFLVIRDTKLPAILCETGYINTTKDFKAIQKISFQKKVAHDIQQGINQYLGK